MNQVDKVDKVDRFNLEQAITYAIEAIKAAMLLNGGAAIALMTLMGAVKKDGGLQLNVGTRVALVISFGVGTCFGRVLALVLRLMIRFKVKPEELENSWS
jgi:hypothetical protein